MRATSGTLASSQLYSACMYCASIVASESARLAVSEWGSESVPLIDQATR